MPKPKPKPRPKLKPEPKPRGMTDTRSPPRRNREPDDRKPARPKRPRKIGLNLDGSVTATPGSRGVALPSGDGFPSPGDAPEDWTTDPGEDSSEKGPDDGAGTTDVKKEVDPGKAAREEAEAAEEAREVLEDADADRDGVLSSEEKAEQAADRMHDRIETKSLRKVRRKPKLEKNVRPPYPEDLRELEVEGLVALELVVDETGRVSSAKILRRLHPTLDKLAGEAAMELEFAPATVDGAAVQVKIPWEFIFVLE